MGCLCIDEAWDCRFDLTHHPHNWVTLGSLYAAIGRSVELAGLPDGGAQRLRDERDDAAGDGDGLLDVARVREVADDVEAGNVGFEGLGVIDGDVRQS